MTQQVNGTRTRATGRIEVKTYEDEVYDAPSEGPVLRRITVMETLR